MNHKKKQAFNNWKLIHLDNLQYWLKRFKETNDQQYYEKYKQEKEYFDKTKATILGCNGR